MTMTPDKIRESVIAQFQQVAGEQNKRLSPLTDDLELLHCGLDSLCFAIVVARLEIALEVDPFTENEDAAFPVTFGEFVRFYQNAAA
jgi:hypothetical protein